MVLEKILPKAWKRAALLSATWAAAVGAFSLIMNAIPSLAIPLLFVIIPLSLAVPAAIGFAIVREFASKGRIDTKAAAIEGAKAGPIYAVIMVIVGLFFTLVNYGIAALYWGVETFVEGIIVMVLTVVIGLPIVAVIATIAGALGGAIYSMLNK
ncbi:MAG: hypothetical protein NUV67_04555 [archaeon]|nr:hypothetical protein [archaeon]